MGDWPLLHGLALQHKQRLLARDLLQTSWILRPTQSTTMCLHT